MRTCTPNACRRRHGVDLSPTANDSGARYTDKVVVVTGGGSGLGRAMSRAFAGEGASVAVLDIDADAAEQTVQADGKACAYACDVSDEAAVTTTFSAVDDDLGRWTS